ncbi:MAG TPA: hypothetical protein DEF47_21710 [Herpetosiphon sp.]|uniref:Uncharacterized protein n=1 Tax=Herpetosiphon aurantiacus (strain ATCC 23779 / DSM 785 / 114-95) TaxID=316274 RepID=A9AVX3_HERA2|nr:hypothetical protein [Herpetosiphon sp.]ABX03211.1 hypothetical protein Haur_0563 [Herpetosiphon aurantiacus DSM 785]HBW52508.1 hypothetical protein [Herpetosiphon sp.]
MPTAFDNLSVEAAKKRLPTTPEAVKSAVLFRDGDHWQGGAAWTGPAPASTDKGATEVMTRIQREFVSSNVIAEVIERHANGAVGREPQWSYALRRPLLEEEQPNTQEQALLDEAEAAMTSWWDQRNVLGILQESIATAVVHGRAVLRLFVPPAVVEGGVIQRQPSLADALNLIWLDGLSPEQAGVSRDTATMQACGVYVYTNDAKQEVAEVTFLDGLDTVMRTLEGEAVTGETRLPLMGHLLMIEITCKPLIGLPMQQMQKALNMTLTMLQHNIVISGFVERVMTNAQMPFDEVDDPTNPGKKTRVYRPYDIGPGKTTNLVGLPMREKDGQIERITGYTTPSVQWRDPVPVGTFIDTDAAIYSRMLKECKQLHALLSGDAVASGESRKQALLDFAMSLGPTATALKQLVRWVLEAALALAAHFAGRAQAFDSLRADVTPRLWLGSLSSEERNFLLAAYEKGAISHDLFLSLIEVEDVDAEKARIAAEQEEKQARSARSLGAALAMQQARLDSGAASTGLEQPQ